MKKLMIILSMFFVSYTSTQTIPTFESETQYICSICNKKLSWNEVFLSKGISAISNKLVYLCSSCSQSTNSKNDRGFTSGHKSDSKAAPSDFHYGNSYDSSEKFGTYLDQKTMKIEIMGYKIQMKRGNLFFEVFSKKDHQISKIVLDESVGSSVSEMIPLEGRVVFMGKKKKKDGTYEDQLLFSYAPGAPGEVHSPKAWPLLPPSGNVQAKPITWDLDGIETELPSKDNVEYLDV